MGKRTPILVITVLGILTAQLAAFVTLIRGAAAFTGRVPVVWAWVAFVPAAASRCACDSRGLDR